MEERPFDRGPGIPPRYVIVVSQDDPVAAGVGSRLPAGERLAPSVDDAPIRAVRPDVLRVDRPGPAILDEGLDERFPSGLLSASTAFVFPSVHRSARGDRCFTVHPLGNPGPAELGGSPGRLGLTAPRLMAAALRGLSRAGRPLGLPATYEATHHGPLLGHPALFVEIACEPEEVPAAATLDALARVVVDLVEDPRDRIAVGIGGGHYAPHFTDLALTRRWAFGHLIPRHALDVASARVLEEAWRGSPGAEGYLFHRAADADNGPGRALRPRLAEGLAPPRGEG